MRFIFDHVSVGSICPGRLFAPRERRPSNLTHPPASAEFLVAGTGQIII
jgi:hypothetical protein